MVVEIITSVLLVLFLLIVLGFGYLWLLWIIADMTNP